MWTWTPPTYEGGSLRAALPHEGWQRAAKLVGKRHGLPLGGATMFSSGSDVVMGAGDLVFKLTAPRWVEEIEAEARMLRLVDGHLDIATPIVIAEGTLSGWPYVVMTHVPGEPLGAVWAELDRPDRLRIARDLGRLTASLHAVPSEGLEDDWDAFIGRMRASARERMAKRKVPARWLQRIDAFLDATPLAPAPLVPLHTEILDQHVLLEERDGRWEIAAMLDFADGRLGHPDYEWAALVEFVFKGEPGALGACLRGYGWDDSECTPERSLQLVAWGLLHQFGDLRRALAAAGDPEPDSFEALAGRVYDLSL